MEENIVKRVCKELGLTYKQLGEKIGYSEGALKQAVSKNQVSDSMQKAIEMYLRILELEEKENNVKDFKRILRNFIQD